MNIRPDQKVLLISAGAFFATFLFLSSQSPYFKEQFGFMLTLFVTVFIVLYNYHYIKKRERYQTIPVQKINFYENFTNGFLMDIISSFNDRSILQDDRKLELEHQLKAYTVDSILWGSSDFVNNLKALHDSLAPNKLRNPDKSIANVSELYSIQGNLDKLLKSIYTDLGKEDIRLSIIDLKKLLTETSEMVSNS